MPVSDIFNFVKEDLPTWKELYYEFYKDRNVLYDPNRSDSNKDDNKLDKYWGIPRKKFLIATATNQLNRDLRVNNMMPELIKMLNNRNPHRDLDVAEIVFSCEPRVYFNPREIAMDKEYEKKYNEWMDRYITDVIDQERVTKIPIYTLSMPDGKANPFIIPNDHNKRVMINDITGMMFPYPIIFTYPRSVRSTKTDSIRPISSFYTPEPLNTTIDDWIVILDFMMSKYKEYFENGVGWKDENGNLMDSLPNETNCVGSGADPAL